MGSGHLEDGGHKHGIWEMQEDTGSCMAQRMKTAVIDLHLAKDLVAYARYSSLHCLWTEDLPAAQNGHPSGEPTSCKCIPGLG